MCNSTPLTIVVAALAATTALVSAETQLDHDPSREEMAQGRDLNSYDDAGDIRELQLNAQKLEALRAFIWDHWQKRKRGYYRFSYHDVDYGNQFFIFIEPKDSAASHIVIRRVEYWSGGGVVRRTLYDLPEVTTLQRRPPEKDRGYGGEFVLVFRDKDGKEVHRF